MEKYPKEITKRLLSHVAKYYISYVDDNIETFRKFECLTSVIVPEPDYWGIIDDADDKFVNLRNLYQHMDVFNIACDIFWGVQNDSELSTLLKSYPELQIETDFYPFANHVLERFHSLDKQIKNVKPLTHSWVDVVKMDPPPPSKLSPEEQKIKKKALSTHINKVMSALCLELL